MTTTEPHAADDGATTDAGGGDDDLHRVVAAQADLIEQLQRRLERLEGERRAPAAHDASSATPSPASTPSSLDASTSRRNLMTKGAAAAATAVIGTAAVGLATAQPAAAASGTFDGNPAVNAVASPSSGVGVQTSSTSGYGALAFTDTGYAVTGQAESPMGIGVYGNNTGTTGAAIGVLAQSTGGTAVLANADSATGTGVVSHSLRTQLRFSGTPAVPPSAGLARLRGELVFDTNADLWLCVADGTPGTWRKVSGAATAGAFTVLPSTIRIYDSRPGTNPLNVTKGQLGNLAERTIDAKIGGAVPAGATAVLVNLTIVNTTGSGYLGLFKNGIAYPGNSTINWNQPNTLLANSAVVAVDDQARFAVKANTGFCDFVIDAIGYYR